MLKLWCCSLLLFSFHVQAEAIKSITLFGNNQIQIQDSKAPSSIDIQHHNLDGIKNVDQLLTTRMRADVTVASKGTPLEVHEKALSDIMNSNEWQQFYQQYQVAALSLQKASEYNITKVPAAVINDHYIIYGAENLSDVLSIAKQQGLILE